MTTNCRAAGSLFSKNAGGQNHWAPARRQGRHRWCSCPVLASPDQVADGADVSAVALDLQVTDILSWLLELNPGRNVVVMKAKQICKWPVGRTFQPTWLLGQDQGKFNMLRGDRPTSNQAGSPCPVTKPSVLSSVGRSQSRKMTPAITISGQELRPGARGGRSLGMTITTITGSRDHGSVGGRIWTGAIAGVLGVGRDVHHQVEDSSADQVMDVGRNSMATESCDDLVIRVGQQFLDCSRGRRRRGRRLGHADRREGCKGALNAGSTKMHGWEATPTCRAAPTAGSSDRENWTESSCYQRQGKERRGPSTDAVSGSGRSDEVDPEPVPGSGRHRDGKGGSALTAHLPEYYAPTNRI